MSPLVASVLSALLVLFTLGRVWTSRSKGADEQILVDKVLRALEQGDWSTADRYLAIAPDWLQRRVELLLDDPEDPVARAAVGRGSWELSRSTWHQDVPQLLAVVLAVLVFSTLFPGPWSTLLLALYGTSSLLLALLMVQGTNQNALAQQLTRLIDADNRERALKLCAAVEGWLGEAFARVIRGSPPDIPTLEAEVRALQADLDRRRWVALAYTNGALATVLAVQLVQPLGWWAGVCTLAILLLGLLAGGLCEKGMSDLDDQLLVVSRWTLGAGR